MEEGFGISLCMIVRDEAENLTRCLSSVQGVADEIVVVDTGSRDGTPDLARRLGARTYTYRWTGDFAAARNFSLEQARGRWILVLDADEELLPGQEERLQTLARDDSVEACLVQIANLTGDPNRPDEEVSINLRFFRNRPEYRYSGALHEQIGENILKANPRARIVDSGIRIRHTGYLNPVVAGKGKLERNLRLAQQMVQENPEDAFARFNLGIEWQRRGRYEEAGQEYAVAYRRATPGTYWAGKLVKSYATTLLNLGRSADALSLLEREIPRYNGFTDLVFLRGLSLLQTGQRPQAAASFYQCLLMGPAAVPPYTGAETGLGSYKAALALGQVLAEMGRAEEAASWYEQAFLQGGKGWLEPLRRLAGILLPMSGPSATAHHLEGLLGEIGPERGVLIGDILAGHKAYDAALAALDGAKAVGVSGAALSYLRSLCLLKLGRFAEAEQEAAAVPVDSSYGRPALVHRLFCLWAEDRVAEARALLQERQPDPDLRREVADMFQAEAEEVLEEGLRRFPQSSLLERALRQLREGGRAHAG